MWVTIETEDLSTFDTSTYFKEYDFWKETSHTSADIEYDEVTEKLDTTNPEGKNYTVKLIRVKDCGVKLGDESLEAKLKSRYFFVAEEKYSEEEILKLRPYCRCIACKASIFSLEKYFTCRCCVGCLHASEERISHYVVKETRKYYRLKQLPFLMRFSSSVSSVEDD